MDVQRQSPCGGSKPLLTDGGWWGHVWHSAKSKFQWFTCPNSIDWLLVSHINIYFFSAIQRDDGLRWRAYVHRLSHQRANWFYSCVAIIPIFSRNSGWEARSTHLRAFSPDESEIALQYREDPLKLRVIRNFIATERVLVGNFSQIPDVFQQKRHLKPV